VALCDSQFAVSPILDSLALDARSALHVNNF